jgi:ureidoacrylate peracid hydrolase
MVALGDHPALIVIDMQNSFLREEGSMNHLGLSPSAVIHTVEPVLELIKGAREAGIPVIYTREGLAEDYSDGGQFIKFFPATKDVNGLIRGTWDWELADEIQPIDGEYTVDKTRYSAFYKTDLEEILRKEGVDSVILCGITTECCVESAARDAFFRDFGVVVVADAVAAYSAERHESTLTTIRFCFGQTPSVSEVMEALAARQALVTK